MKFTAMLMSTSHCTAHRMGSVFMVAFLILGMSLRAKSPKALLPTAATFETVDRLFRSLPELDSEDRATAIRTLNSILTSKKPGESELVVYYHSHVELVSKEAKKITPIPERYAALSRAIPILISTLDGKVNNPAYWILISIQPYCPPPAKNLWEQWWTDSGKAYYENNSKKKP